jgi:hypothetical protein
MKWISTFFILLSFSIYSQQTSWTYNHPVWYYAYTNVAESGYIKLVDSGDTILQGKTCMKLNATKYSFFITGPNGGMFETNSSYISGVVYNSNDTIFHWNNDHFNVLYVFNPVLNQQWVVFDNTPFLNCTDSSRVQVIATGTEILNNNQFDYYQLTTLAGSGVGIDSKVCNTIGPLGAYFFPTTRNCDSTIIPEFDQIHLICFEDDSIAVNPANEICEWHLGTEDNQIETFSYYPNPTTGDLLLSAEHEIGDISIIDLFGNCVLRSQTNESFLKIDMTFLANGIYLLKSTTNPSVIYFIQKTN